MSSRRRRSVVTSDSEEDERSDADVRPTAEPSPDKHRQMKRLRKAAAAECSAAGGMEGKEREGVENEGDGAASGRRKLSSVVAEERKKVGWWVKGEEGATRCVRRRTGTAPSGEARGECRTA